MTTNLADDEAKQLAMIAADVRSRLGRQSAFNFSSCGVALTKNALDHTWSRAVRAVWQATCSAMTAVPQGSRGQADFDLPAKYARSAVVRRI